MMTAASAAASGYQRSNRMELTLSTKLNAFCDFLFLFGLKKCGRNTNANRVVPRSANDANRPKSLRSSLVVNRRPENAPIVVRHPRHTGRHCSRMTISGSDTYL